MIHTTNYLECMDCIDCIPEYQQLTKDVNKLVSAGYDVTKLVNYTVNTCHDSIFCNKMSCVIQEITNTQHNLFSLNYVMAVCELTDDENLQYIAYDLLAQKHRKMLVDAGFNTTVFDDCVDSGITNCNQCVCEAIIHITDLEHGFWYRHALIDIFNAMQYCTKESVSIVRDLRKQRDRMEAAEVAKARKASMKDVEAVQRYYDAMRHDYENCFVTDDQLECEYTMWVEQQQKLYEETH
jgi:hypothetical protein